jgi:hypothetical protein
MSELNKRKSVLTKSIRRTFNLGNFQSLEISLSTQEEVEWTDIKEREEKSSKVTKILLKDFEKTKDEVFVQLGLSEAVTVTDNLQKSKSDSLKNNGVI